MGPNCPECDECFEMTEGEIREVIYSPKTYMCSKCMCIWTLSPEEVEVVQEQARTFYAPPPTSETPEDWAKLRSAWDKRGTDEEADENEQYPW